MTEIQVELIEGNVMLAHVHSLGGKEDSKK